MNKCMLTSGSEDILLINLSRVELYLFFTCPEWRLSGRKTPILYQ
jgi:hypothetical protein